MYVYKPTDRYGPLIDESRCRYGVSSPPFYLRERQCSRKPVVEVNGVPYCKQHGKIVADETGFDLQNLQKGEYG